MKKITTLLIALLTALISFAQAPGNALSFDGGNDSVSVPYNPAFTMNEFTLEAWFKTTATYGSLISLGDFTSPQSGIEVALMYSDAKLTFRHAQSTTNNNLKVSSVNNLNDNRWHHMAVVKESGLFYRMYVDGALVSSGTMAGWIPTANGLNLRIGSAFNGEIDEIRIWNIARSESEILGTMDQEVSPAASGLLAYYKFDEPSPAIVLPDMTANMYDGTLYNMDPATDWVESYAMVIPWTTAATNIGWDGFDISWNAPVSGVVENYYLEVATDAAFTNRLPGYDPYKDMGTSLSESITGLQIATDYFFRVRAVKSSVGDIGFIQNARIQKTDCIINDYAVSAATSSFCNSGTTTIDVANSQSGVTYYLRDNGDNSHLDTLEGTNAALSFPVNVATTTTYNVHAEKLGLSGAMEFNGTDQYVLVPDNPALDINSSITLEAMVYIPVDFTAPQTIIDKAATTTYGLGLGSLFDQNVVNLYLGSSFARLTTPANALTSGVWQHVAATFDDVSDAVVIYVNGEIAASGSFTGTYGTNNISVGLGAANSGAANFFNGKMDEVRIWNVARSQAEIQAAMDISLVGNESGLVAYYQFEDGAGTSVSETTSNGFTGTTYNMTDANWVTRTIVECSSTMTSTPQIIVTPDDDPSFSYDSQIFCSNDLNPVPTITGTTNGTFTELSGSVAVDLNSGVIDLTNSAFGDYTITYTTNGVCPASATFDFSINESYNTINFQDICTGDIFTLPDLTEVSTTGIYTTTVTSTNGCDSTIETHLFVHESFPQQPQLELFFSEYIEGTSNNKAIEIYNPKNETVDLADYTIFRFTNGSPTATATLVLSGSLAAGDVVVIASSLADAAIVAEADILDNITNYNGDDALLLVNNVTGDTLDIFGRIGQDPGTNWTQGALATSEQTLLRNPTVYSGIMHNPATYFETLESEWISYPQNTFSYIGSHTMDPVPVAGLTVTGICEGDSVMIYGNWESTPGLYYDSLLSVYGCDSVYTTELIVYPVYMGSSAATICEGDSILIGGTWQTQEGTFNDTLSSVNFCDSIIAITVSFDQAPIVDAGPDEFACNNNLYVILAGTTANSSGVTWTTSGTGIFMPDPNNEMAVYSISSEDSLAGTITLTLSATATGVCQPVSDELTVTIVPTYEEYEIVSICSGDSVFVEGNWVSSPGNYSGNYTSIYNCDSIHNTEVIVNPVYSVYSTAGICQGDSIYLGGAWQTAAGIFSDTLSSEFFCDSIIETEVFVSMPATYDTTISLCQGDSIFAGGSWQFADGTFSDTLATTMYCDSIVNSQLNFIPLPEVDLGPEDTLCDFNAPWEILLDAGNPGATYNWYNGTDLQTLLINGEDLAMFYGGGWPGWYPVWVDVTINGCTNSDTVMMFVDYCEGMANINNEAQIKIYPNPADDELTIEIPARLSETTVEILDITGRSLETLHFAAQAQISQILNISEYPAGMIYLKVTSGDSVYIGKVIIR